MVRFLLRRTVCSEDENQLSRDVDLSAGLQYFPACTLAGGIENLLPLRRVFLRRERENYPVLIGIEKQ